MRGSAPPYLCNLSTSSGPGSLTATPLDAAFSSLFYLFALSACACRFEVTVTSVSLPPFMSRRGLVIYIPVRVALKLRSIDFAPLVCGASQYFNTNQRSLTHPVCVASRSFKIQTNAFSLNSMNSYFRRRHLPLSNLKKPLSDTQRPQFFDSGFRQGRNEPETSHQHKVS